jgi:predicted RNA-binding protein with PUA-like domain
MKCEPAAYTIDDLARDGRTSWEGVRNYQARNIMRDQMQEGDGVLFYASNAEPPGVTGLATIARAGYPDHFAWKNGHKYFDEAGSAESPVWYMVDVGFIERFPAIVTLDTLKHTPGLEKMVVIQKGSRLSVQPVTPDEYEIVVKLGHATQATAGGGDEPARAIRGTKTTAPRAAATRRGAKSKSARR